MDWKDKGIEAAYLGGLAIVGTWLTKKFKPLSKWFTNLSKLSTRVDEIEKDYKSKIDALEKEFTSKIERLEDRLAKDENMLRSKFDSSEDATFILDSNFELIYGNVTYLEALGFTSDEEAFGVQFLNATPTHFEEKMNKLMKDLKEHPSKFSRKLPFKNVKTDEEFFMEWRSTPIYDYKDTLYCTLGFLYKIN